MYLEVIVACVVVSCVCSAPAEVISSSQPATLTTVKAIEVSEGIIESKILKKPHHLFIGRCQPDDKVLHQENIVLNNDGKSHVAAGIRVTVEAQVNITCVKIYDEVPDGAGGYPGFVAGGVGHTFVEFNVMTDYGKGFHFFIQIYGYEIKSDKN